MNVLYVGNNIIRSNFGCRATSMALYDIIKRHHIISSSLPSVASGDITIRYDSGLYKGDVAIPRIQRYWNKLRGKIKPSKDDANFLSSDVNCSIENFEKVFTKYKPLGAIMQAVKEADALMLNGEGSFIFGEHMRYDLKFYLFILALAQKLDKKTYLLNAMFSDGTSSCRNENTIEQTRLVLQNCTRVIARDRLSLQYYSDYISDNAVYVPDALFSWTKYSQYIPLAPSFQHAGTIFPDDSWQWKDFDFSKPYVVVSAGSRVVYNWSDNTFVQQYAKLIKALKREYRVVIQQTCGGEEFLKDVAKITDTKIIDNKTNILFGMSVLANAQCYVSGRWHPSILASLGGTPCVMLQSNSHKSHAIYTELAYNLEADIYSNPPTDDDITKIVEQVRWTIDNVSRQSILKMVHEKSDMLKLYDELL